MKILLDTHAFLWLITDDERLSEKAQKTFLNPGNRFFFQCRQLLGDLYKKKPRQDFP